MRDGPTRCGPRLGREDRLFPVELNGNEEMFHLSQRRFSLRGRPHRLLLLKHLTRELSRQEVAIWKKLIRVLSHELNNSLAPISSLANSGAELARRGDEAALPGVFTTIAERAAHLHRFIGGYAKFARLPAPRPERVAWGEFVADLRDSPTSRGGAARAPGAVRPRRSNRPSSTC